MPDRQYNLPEVYLHPGEMYLAREPAILATILGSCVGVSFWSPQLRIGALCHAMLPRAPRPLREIGEVDGPRYVDYCIYRLSYQFQQLGLDRSAIQVKVFGGADVLFVTTPNTRPSIGRLNCETALALLNQDGYTITATSLGETCGRKIRFNTSTGGVLLFRLS
ncbi:MAG: chemotaxis protein CheD [Acidobacteriota bacterium]